jgi:hypothetical protein
MLASWQGPAYAAWHVPFRTSDSRAIEHYRTQGISSLEAHMTTLFDGSSIPQSPRAYTVHVEDGVIAGNIAKAPTSHGGMQSCRITR